MDHLKNLSVINNPPVFTCRVKDLLPLNALSQLVREVCIRFSVHGITITGRTNEKQMIFKFSLERPDEQVVVMPSGHSEIMVGVEPNVFHVALSRFPMEERIAISFTCVEDQDTRAVVYAITLKDLHEGHPSMWEFEPIDAEYIKVRDMTALRSHMLTFSLDAFKKIMDRIGGVGVSQVRIHAENNSNRISFECHGRAIRKMDGSITSVDDKMWSAENANGTCLNDVFGNVFMKSLKAMSSCSKTIHICWLQGNRIVYMIDLQSGGYFFGIIAPIPEKCQNIEVATKRARVPAPKRKWTEMEEWGMENNEGDEDEYNFEGCGEEEDDE